MTDAASDKILKPFGLKVEITSQPIENKSRHGKYVRSATYTKHMRSKSMING